jgi:hypothetical protein
MDICRIPNDSIQFSHWSLLLAVSVVPLPALSADGLGGIGCGRRIAGGGSGRVTGNG